MKKALKSAAVIPILIGVLLIAAGVLIQSPGGALTTYENLDGVSTDYYTFDDRYSAIDEYVGGDAYNYIIGAALVAGKMSGFIAGKAVLIAVGCLCLSCGGAMIVIANGMRDRKTAEASVSTRPGHEIAPNYEYNSNGDMYEEDSEDTV